MIIDVTDVCGFDVIRKSFRQLSSYRAAHSRPEATHQVAWWGEMGCRLMTGVLHADILACKCRSDSCPVGNVTLNLVVRAKRLELWTLVSYELFSTRQKASK